MQGRLTGPKPVGAAVRSRVGSTDRGRLPHSLNLYQSRLEGILYGERVAAGPRAQFLLSICAQWLRCTMNSTGTP